MQILGTSGETVCELTPASPRINVQIHGFQPYLFPEMASPRSSPDGQTSDNKRRDDAKSILRALYRLRNCHEENVFEPVITNAINEIRAVSNCTENQFRERILYAIERQMAWTIGEIVEETNLKRDFVQSALNEMARDGLVKFPPKYIPGSDRQYYLVKSTRIDDGEMDVIAEIPADELDYF